MKRRIHPLAIFSCVGFGLGAVSLLFRFSLIRFRAGLVDSSRAREIALMLLYPLALAVLALSAIALAIRLLSRTSGVELRIDRWRWLAAGAIQCVSPGLVGFIPLRYFWLLQSLSGAFSLWILAGRLHVGFAIVVFSPWVISWSLRFLSRGQ